MKKLLFFLVTLACSTSFIQAQSKFSYSVLVNQSTSTDDVVDVCILRTTGGTCIDLDKVWKTNITLAANYAVSNRIRLQSGLGYNVINIDQLNSSLNTNLYSIRYLSIPVRVHYLFNKGRVRFYAGAGFRTDIRLNKHFSISSALDNLEIQDNGRNIAVSFEGLVGIEVPITPSFKVSMEPTYASAITSYGSDLRPIYRAGLGPFPASHTLTEAYPSRIGVTLGFTYSFN